MHNGKTIIDIEDSVKRAEKNACYGNGEPTADDGIEIKPLPVLVDVLLLARSYMLLNNSLAHILLNDMRCARKLEEQIELHMEEILGYVKLHRLQAEFAEATLSAAEIGERPVAQA